MSTGWLDFHRQSEKLAGEAHLSVAQSRGGAADLYGRAATFEELAFERVDTSKPRTRGIIAVSAAALHLKAGNRRRAESIARKLAEDPDLPDFAIRELQEIADEARA